ncbi:MAG TPA: hypothetical protein VGU69_07595 [Rhizomicrobium sp.]|nr:hypothetical protein [Rhizomicrobium sp.]
MRIEQLRKERDANFKDVVNEAIRLGLDQMATPARQRERFATIPLDCGKPLFHGPDDLKQIIAELDEEDDRRRLGRP